MHSKNTDIQYRKRIGKKAKYYGIGYLVNKIKHKSIKYNTECIDTCYIPDFTSSNKCSECGHINVNRLKLSNRVFVCEKCDYSDDRDYNAAVNCYNYMMEYFGFKKIQNKALYMCV